MGFKWSRSQFSSGTIANSNNPEILGGLESGGTELAVVAEEIIIVEVNYEVPQDWGQVQVTVEVESGVEDVVQVVEQGDKVIA